MGQFSADFENFPSYSIMQLTPPLVSRTDNDFREFHRRIDSDWDKFDESEKYRAHCLAVRSIGSMLNELVAYFDGQISQTEFRSLRWNMQNAKKRSEF